MLSVRVLLDISGTTAGAEAAQAILNNSFQLWAALPPQTDFEFVALIGHSSELQTLIRSTKAPPSQEPMRQWAGIKALIQQKFQEECPEGSPSPASGGARRIGNGKCLAGQSCLIQAINDSMESFALRREDKTPNGQQRNYLLFLLSDGLEDCKRPNLSGATSSIRLNSDFRSSRLDEFDISSFFVEDARRIAPRLRLYITLPRHALSSSNGGDVTFSQIQGFWNTIFERAGLKLKAEIQSELPNEPFALR